VGKRERGEKTSKKNGTRRHESKPGGRRGEWENGRRGEWENGRRGFQSDSHGKSCNQKSLSPPKTKDQHQTQVAVRRDTVSSRITPIGQIRQTFSSSSSSSSFFPLHSSYGIVWYGWYGILFLPSSTAATPRDNRTLRHEPTTPAAADNGDVLLVAHHLMTMN
jgi:hypothetical protein